jgi:hypothetical protein
LQISDLIYLVLMRPLKLGRPFEQPLHLYQHQLIEKLTFYSTYYLLLRVLLQVLFEGQAKVVVQELVVVCSLIYQEEEPWEPMEVEAD